MKIEQKTFINFEAL